MEKWFILPDVVVFVKIVQWRKKTNYQNHFPLETTTTKCEIWWWNVRFQSNNTGRVVVLVVIILEVEN